MHATIPLDHISPIRSACHRLALRVADDIRRDRARGFDAIANAQSNELSRLLSAVGATFGAESEINMRAACAEIMENKE